MQINTGIILIIKINTNVAGAWNFEHFMYKVSYFTLRIFSGLPGTKLLY